MTNRTVVDHKFALGDTCYTKVKGIIIPFKVDCIMIVVDDHGAKVVYGCQEHYTSEDNLFTKAEEVK